jgi:hypothetical protein
MLGVKIKLSKRERSCPRTAPSDCTENPCQQSEGLNPNNPTMKRNDWGSQNNLYFIFQNSVQFDQQ